MNLAHQTRRSTFLTLLVLPAVGLSLLLGCGLFGGSTSQNPKVAKASNAQSAAGKLRVGDEIVVRLDTGVTQAGGQSDTPSDVTIDEDGNISLPLIGRLKAEGLTASELAERVQANYVPRYYVRCTATVLIAQRFYYVGGEVKNPNRFQWSEDTTLLKAINTASGFTDYANRRKVQLVSGQGAPQFFDCDDLQRNPAKDVPIRPGDTITVPRSLF